MSAAGSAPIPEEPAALDAPLLARGLAALRIFFGAILFTNGRRFRGWPF